MNKQIEQSFTLGGSIEKALSGDYELNVSAVLAEAWKFTIKNFWSYLLAIIILLAVQMTIFIVALELQIGDIANLIVMIEQTGTIDKQMIEAISIANFSYEAISAPIYAGVSLMAMSHAAGLLSRPIHILKGLSFTVPVIIATVVSLTIQASSGFLFFLLPMYFSMAFNCTVLLICEKRIPPLQALWLSFRAFNKKILPLLGIYCALFALLVLSIMFYGVFLILTLPLFFHAKGIIYRNMFGISLKIVSASDNIAANQESDTESNKRSKDSDDDDDQGNNQGSDTFNA